MYHFVTAPNGLLREELERLQQQNADSVAYIEELTQKLDAATDTKRRAIEVAGSLVSYREQAIHTLLNRRVKNGEDLARLKTDIAEWEKNVVSFMESSNVPLGRITTFRVLGTYDTRVTGGYSAEHNRELAMLWARLGRLLDIVNDVSE